MTTGLLFEWHDHNLKQNELTPPAGPSGPTRLDWTTPEMNPLAEHTGEGPALSRLSYSGLALWRACPPQRCLSGETWGSGSTRRHCTRHFGLIPSSLPKNPNHLE